MKRLTILGATGSIGRSTLDIVRRHRDRFRVEALVANASIERLARDAVDVGARLAVTADPSRLEELRAALAGSGVEAAAGEAAVLEAAARPVDMVMAAIVGVAGLKPTLAALEAGNVIALANKECLVSAGELFMARAADRGVAVIPVDSEHSAIFQCFERHNAARVEKVTLTASGGPFRTRSPESLAAVTPEEALKHPNWDMGVKVTIDSATLMNKGLELIEAYHLYPVSASQLEAIIHPQSIVHSLVSYVDGSTLAQLGVPDMRTPIACALAWPERIETPVARLDLAALGQLTFEPVDAARFPAPGLALAALERAGNATTILNAANEVAVAAFLEGRIRFTGIVPLVAETLEAAERAGALGHLASIEDVWAADDFGRRTAEELARSPSVGAVAG
ncbi:MAG TPA: 1-deoxy-D-xylulose-5-phosphate reductoisomerase [Thermopetrobacter sp.]|nr:1-deoxy-D-xylulose-5-phosphate reductoisomerase [Thermopetrobacter sp.]